LIFCAPIRQFPETLETGVLYLATDRGRFFLADENGRASGAQHFPDVFVSLLTAEIETAPDSLKPFLQAWLDQLTAQDAPLPRLPRVGDTNVKGTVIISAHIPARNLLAVNGNYIPEKWCGFVQISIAENGYATPTAYGYYTNSTADNLPMRLTFESLSELAAGDHVSFDIVAPARTQFVLDFYAKMGRTCPPPSACARNIRKI